MKKPHSTTSLKVAPDQPKPDNERVRRVQIRYIIPSLVTVFAICAGLTAVRMSIDGRLTAALYLIILAVFLDAADGKIARYLDTASPFGAELDTLADFFNFGIAPGILIYNAVYHFSDYANIGWLSCLVLAVACALRLARFNLSLGSDPKNPVVAQYFTGVPAPALACLSLTPIFLIQLGWVDIVRHAYAIAIYIIVVAGLAVSTIPTFSIKHASISRQHVPLVLLSTMALVMCLMVYPWHTLLVANALYLLSMPLSYRQARRRAAEASA